MAKYRKKPVVIEAIQWTGKNTSTVRKFCPTVTRIFDGRKITLLVIGTYSIRGTSGDKIYKNDWIVKNIWTATTVFQVYKPDIFEKMYEVIEDSNAKEI